MARLSILVRHVAEAIATTVLTWRTAWYEGRYKRARARHKQHWQAGQIGGGAIQQLGWLTEAEAIAKVKELKSDNEPIAFVDFERGFIAYGRHPS